MARSYNPEVALFAMTTLTWTWTPGGTWEFAQETNIQSLNRYYNEQDEVRAGFEVVYVILLAYFVLLEMFEMFDAHRKTSFISYFYDARNWLDMITYAIMTAAVSVWCHVYFGPVSKDLQPEHIPARFDVYSDFFATADLVNMRSDGQEFYEEFFSKSLAVVAELRSYQLCVELCQSPILRLRDCAFAGWSACRSS